MKDINLQYVNALGGKVYKEMYENAYLIIHAIFLGFSLLGLKLF